MKKRTKEYAVLLVLTQIAAIGLVIMTTPLHIYQAYSFLPFGLVSCILLLWAVFSMKVKTVNIFPALRKNAEPAFGGPYKTVRHPMYLSVLTFTVPLLLHHFTFFRLFAIIFLVTVLIMKIELEEQLLKERFPGYANYSLRTYRLIPYIF
jgi:protein-S-isoprenylcysteine O-methyltransferase Ste14